MSEIETRTFKMNNAKVPDGTILILGIRYDQDGDTRGRTNPKVYPYTFSKFGGVWYGTGTGKVPQAAGWPAVEKWLGRDGRELVYVKAVTESAQVWPTVGLVEPAPGFEPRPDDEMSPGSIGSENE